MGLNHPDLGTAGGSALWTLINNLYLNLGNALPSRWLESSSLANGATVTLTHGFRLGFALLKCTAYSASAGADDGTDDLTRLNQNAAGVTIVKNATNPTTQIDITNNTGSTINFLRVLVEQEVHSPYQWIVDPGATAAGNVFTTLAGAIAAAAAGDKILVKKGTNETLTALVTQSVDDLTIEWQPGAKTIIGGSLTAGINITGKRCRLIAPWLRADATTVLYPLKTAAADSRVVNGLVEVNNAGTTLTAAIQVNSGGDRAIADIGILVTAGAATSDFEDNVGTLRGSFAR